jgi:hypothetical protein
MRAPVVMTFDFPGAHCDAKELGMFGKRHLNVPGRGDKGMSLATSGSSTAVLWGGGAPVSVVP